MIDLDTIRARLQAATSGPWRVEPDSRPDILTVWTVDGTGGYFDGGQILRNTRRWRSDITGGLHVAEFAKYANGMEDAEFIAHAPADIAALMAEVEQLRFQFDQQRECSTELLAEVEHLRAELAAAKEVLPWTEALISAIVDVARRASQICPGGATFDQLAEEVLELHLSLRGKHKDTPAMEWLEIATIAINALECLPTADVDAAWLAWISRHGGTQNDG